MYRRILIFIYCLGFHSAVAEALTLNVAEVDTIQGAAGIQVAVGIEDGLGFTGGDLIIRYDASALSAKQVLTGELLASAGALVVANLQVPGEIKVSMAGASGLVSALGNLFTIVFDVRFDAEIKRYPITLSDIALRDEQGQLLTVSGMSQGSVGVTAADSLPTPEGTSIMLMLGRVSGDPGDSNLVLDVQVDQIRGLAGGEMVLKYDPFILSIFGVQASAILDTAGISLVANLNNPGQIEISFAGAIGLPEGEGTLFHIPMAIGASAIGGTYPVQVEKAILFNELGQAFNIATISHGVVNVGDATGEPVDIGNRIINVGSLVSKPGDTDQTIGISVDDATRIAGGQLTLKYDPDVVIIKDVQGSDLLETAGMTLIFNSNIGGEVKIVFAGSTGIVSGDGILIQVSVDINTGIGQGKYDLGITDVALRNESGQTFLLSQINSGLITVEGDAPSNPTEGGGDFDGTLPSGVRGGVALDLGLDFGDQSIVQSETPKVGDTIVLDIVVTDNGQNLNGFNVVLSFDPDIFSYQSFEAKDVFDGAAVIENKDELVSGRIGLNAAYFGATVTSQSSGTLGQVTFKVLEGFTEVAQISIASAQLAQGGSASTVDIGRGGAYVVIGGAEPSAPAFPSDPVARSDFSGDGNVGFEDFISFAGAFGKTSADADFDARIDLNDNGSVDFQDFIIFAGLFGQSVSGN